MSRPSYHLALRRLTRRNLIQTPQILGARLEAAPFAIGIRSASTVSSPRQPHTPMPMPPDMPREDYTAPTLYTLSYLSRVIRLLLYSVLGISVAGLAGFEGLHLYIEHNLMATPSGSSGSGDPDDWAGENLSWTGRDKGGTDPRLGWKARHALRGAWICQEWGAGGPAGSIGRQNIHGAKKSIGMGVEVNRVDRGYELAEEYIDLAISHAKKRGMVFPGEGDGAGGVDPTAVDLLLLKAGVLERLATQQTLVQAKGIYQDVLAITTDVAKGVRLSGKIGDLAQRTGGEGSAWWMSGLQRAGVDITVQEKERERAKGWFTKKEPASIYPTPSISLSPPVLRAVIGLLISTEANLATSASFSESARVQDLALSLLPPSPSTSLQDTWTTHRRALLTLHSASVAHAQKQPALIKATSAASLADSIIPSIPSYPISSPLHPSAKLLARDAQSLAAEANFTRGVLLEKTDLDAAGECFERAMNHAGERGPEWDRYYRSFARVREKLERKRGVEKSISS